MAQIIKSIKVTWQWDGDLEALKGFNVAITPTGGDPRDTTLAFAFTGKQKFEHTFLNVTFDAAAGYETWVQAVYEGDDSDWINASGVTVPDDGENTLATSNSTQTAIADNVLVRAATDENLVPNGEFEFGTQGWQTVEGTVTALSVVTDANEGKCLDLPQTGANYSQGSKTFRVVPGRKYRARIRAWIPGGTAADDGFYFRIQYRGEFAEPITRDNRAGLTDLISGESFVLDGTPRTYEYEWTAPAGANWANVAVYQWSQSTASFRVAFVELVPYAGVGQWGADVTGSNTSYDTARVAGTTASTVRDNATNAMAAVTDMASDNRLAPTEKLVTKKEWDAIAAEKPTLVNQASAVSVSSTNYVNAYNALDTYLSPLLTDLTTASDIVGSTFRQKFTDYYNQRAALSKLITDKAATTSTWSGVSGTGKPQDNATVGADWDSNLANRPENPVNLVKKASFEDGSTGKWSGTLSVVDVTGQDFSKAMRTSNRDAFETGANNGYFPVAAGQKIFASAAFNTLGATQRVTLGLHITKADGSSSWQSIADLGAGQDWTYVEGSLTVPAGYIKARPWIQIAVPAGSADYADCAQLYLGYAPPAAGNLATKDQVGDSEIDSNSNTYKGAARAAAGLDENGNVARIVDGANFPAGQTPTSAGLALTKEFMGYYNPATSTWGAYISNSGDFQFRGDDNNYIAWDGTMLEIMGRLNVPEILGADSYYAKGVYDHRKSWGEGFVSHGSRERAVLQYINTALSVEVHNNADNNTAYNGTTSESDAGYIRYMYDGNSDQVIKQFGDTVRLTKAMVKLEQFKNMKCSAGTGATPAADNNWVSWHGYAFYFDQGNVYFTSAYNSNATSVLVGTLPGIPPEQINNTTNFTICLAVEFREYPENRIEATLKELYFGAVADPQRATPWELTYTFTDTLYMPKALSAETNPFAVLYPRFVWVIAAERIAPAANAHSLINTTDFRMYLYPH